MTLKIHEDHLDKALVLVYSILFPKYDVAYAHCYILFNGHFTGYFFEKPVHERVNEYHHYL